MNSSRHAQTSQKTSSSESFENRVERLMEGARQQGAEINRRVAAGEPVDFSPLRIERMIQDQRAKTTAAQVPPVRSNGASAASANA